MKRRHVLEPARLIGLSSERNLTDYRRLGLSAGPPGYHGSNLTLVV